MEPGVKGIGASHFRARFPLRLPSETERPGAAAVAPERAVEPAANSATAGLSAGVTGDEDVSRFCPVCSQRLESRRCKLICNICGYYMSCADYY